MYFFFLVYERAVVLYASKNSPEIKKLRVFFVFGLCSLCWQVFHRGSVMQKFHDMTVEIEAALSQIPYDTIEVSEEVREQVILKA